MNTATICLGSNASCASQQIDRAINFIDKLAHTLHDSGDYPSDPEKSTSTDIYTNRIIELVTDRTYNELHRLCKTYESEQRASVIEEGHVTIDIDIVTFNSTILRPLDYASAYFRKGLALI